MGGIKGKRRVRRSLPDHLGELVQGGSAHVRFEDVVADWPPGKRGLRVEGAPHTAWQLVEHLRIAQWDILEFSRRADHVSPDWPTGYWPVTEAPEAGAWDRAVADFLADRAAIESLVASRSAELLEPFHWGDGQTLLREALLVADHNAYHLGQLVLLRRLLGLAPTR